MSGWISTGDSLPKQGDLVAVMIAGITQYSLAMLWDDSWRWLANPDADYAPLEAVDHWMPIEGEL